MFSRTLSAYDIREIGGWPGMLVRLTYHIPDVFIGDPLVLVLVVPSLLH